MQTIHLGLAPRPTLTGYVGKGDRNDHAHLVAYLALSENATFQLFKFSVRPRQNIHDQRRANPLETIHSCSNCTRPDQNINVPMNEPLQTALVFAGEEA